MRGMCVPSRGQTSREFNGETENAVIDLMPEQQDIENMGGTMRLGAYPCSLKEGTLAISAYGVSEISERHRHRYEVNNDLRDILREKGMEFSGLSPDGNLVEIIEIHEHPWFLGCQFHPEFKSKPNIPHPLFREFVKAAKRFAEREPESV